MNHLDSFKLKTMQTIRNINREAYRNIERFDNFTPDDTPDDTQDNNVIMSNVEVEEDTPPETNTRQFRYSDNVFNNTTFK